MRRIGIDTGGTFTDLLLLEDGVLQAFKVPSTPADPSVADTKQTLWPACIHNAAVPPTRYSQSSG